MALFTALGIMLVLLLFKGFFSGSEIALVSADKIQMHHRARMGERGAKMLLKLFRRPDRMLTTTLVGTNLSTVALTTIGTVLMIDVFGEKGDLVAFLIYTPIFLIFGEIVPKSVYQQKAEALAPVIVYPLKAAALVFSPIIFVFAQVAGLATRWVGAGHAPQSVFLTREQFRAIIEMTERRSEVAAFARGRIRRAVRFGHTQAAEIMTPLRDMPLFNLAEPMDRLFRLARGIGNRPIAVYENNTGNIVGIVFLRIWDLLQNQRADGRIADVMRAPFFAAPRQTLAQLLPILKKRDDQTAVIVDEFGSAIGMVTLEDILTVVVGDVKLGHHFAIPPHRRRRRFEVLAEGVYLLDARLSISELNDVIGLNLPEGDYRTIAGLLLARLSRVPRPDDYIVDSGYRFTVVEATQKAVVSVRAEPES